MCTLCYAYVDVKVKCEFLIELNPILKFAQTALRFTPWQICSLEHNLESNAISNFNIVSHFTVNRDYHITVV